jgi:AFG3 family protein
MTLAGRVSEEIFFGKEAVTSGASDDFQKVTKLAQAYVASYGMSASLGTVSYPLDEDRLSKPFSEATAQLIDEEIRSVINRAHDRTTELLIKHKNGMVLIAQRLLTKEVITYNEVEEILGPRPFATKVSLLLSHFDILAY